MPRQENILGAGAACGECGAAGKPVSLYLRPWKGNMLITFGRSSVASHPASKADAGAMCSEMNHRIVNSLTIIASLISLRASSIGSRQGSMSNREVEGLLSEVRARIEAVALLHRRLAAVPQARAVTLSDHLDPLCRSLVSSLTKSNAVSLHLDLDRDLMLGKDAVLPVTWIVSELVTNAIKYAHPAGSPGLIRVVCRRTESHTLVLEVSDDGVGLPENFDPALDGGLGLKLVNALVDQLGGTMIFESPGIGLHCRLLLTARGQAH